MANGTVVARQSHIINPNGRQLLRSFFSIIQFVFMRTYTRCRRFVEGEIGLVLSFQHGKVINLYIPGIVVGLNNASNKQVKNAQILHIYRTNM